VTDVEHVKCLIHDLPEELTAEQGEQATQFICKNAGMFSRSEFDTGWTPMVKHSTETAIA